MQQEENSVELLKSRISTASRTKTTPPVVELVDTFLLFVFGANMNMTSGNHDTLGVRLAQILIKLNQGEKLEPQALAVCRA